MNTLPWFPRSTFGLVLAVIYIAVAIFVVAGDRSSTSGGWINLHGILAFLITFPISFIGEKLGMRPDFRRNADMAFAIGVCAVLVYFIGVGLVKLTRILFAGGGGPG